MTFPGNVMAKIGAGATLTDKIVAFFEFVRDIPYGDIGSRSAIDVWENYQGTCSGKHALLAELYNHIGIEVRHCLARHYFNDLNVMWPINLKNFLEQNDIPDLHDYLMIHVNGKWIKIDATWDKPLKKLGFTVTENWDGESDQKIAVTVRDEMQVKRPIEAKTELIARLPEDIQSKRKRFLKEMTLWLKEQRN